eukprot:CAMPEP_0184657950 /NCGR_PEP_ID=MMETSP0308-20130426/22982_1 /TAXON_ID=38269 /ORGANISM="Gloeochaete witrockiana, Strain SAG 46.84" /LENGTH=271 /DNA_ID=CAMNT_0027096469 /DNA_START=322 /DNA_END=1137 /DNA_ORIENTATION=+
MYEEVPTPFGMVRSVITPDSRRKRVMSEPELKEFIYRLGLDLRSDGDKQQLNALSEIRFLPAIAAVPLVEQVLKTSTNELVKSQALYALVALGPAALTDALRIIKAVLETESDYTVRAAAAGALGYIEDNDASEILMRAFYEDVNWIVRYSAVVALGNKKNERSLDFLISTLDKQNAEDKSDTLLIQALIGVLGEMKDVRAVEPILRFVGNGDFMVRAKVAEALGNLPSERSVSALEYLEKDGVEMVFRQAELSLKQAKKVIDRVLVRDDF